jgi:proteasome accessory factor A
LVPRSVAYSDLYRAVAPILVARTLLCGAGKVGSEAGDRADFQLSQRADFLVETANVETLYRRPVFNTRDEPHADPSRWVRMHVISGDANRIIGCTVRKVALVQMAVALAIEGCFPVGLLKNPARALSQVSRDPDTKLEFDDSSSKTAEDILMRYLDLAIQKGCMTEEHEDIAAECEWLIQIRTKDRDAFAREVDWAAKKHMIDQFRESEGLTWSDQRLRAFDLEYSNIDPTESLFEALIESGMVDEQLDIGSRMDRPVDPTRALARSIAVSRFGNELTGACWRSVTFGETEVQLDPSHRYSSDLCKATSVESFIEAIETHDHS